MSTAKSNGADGKSSRSSARPVLVCGGAGFSARTCAHGWRRRVSYLRVRSVPAIRLDAELQRRPIPRWLEVASGARRARPLYCSVNVEQYCSQPVNRTFALGYLGTYSLDRQAGLERLLN